MLMTKIAQLLKDNIGESLYDQALQNGSYQPDTATEYLRSDYYLVYY